MGDNVLTPYEAEAYCEALIAFDIKSIGSAKWLQQHEYLEKLNVQAHVCIQNDTDEFVSESLISFEKLPILVHELLSIEVWREKVYPELVKLDFVSKSSMAAYMVFYHEGTVLTLLEAVLYNKEAVEGLGDSVIDLVDYCHRRMVWLNSTMVNQVEEREFDDPASDKKKDARAQLEMSGTELLEDQIKDLPLETAVKAVAVVRYLTDHVTVLPLSCLTRMLNVHDFPSMLVPLITDAPWTRTRNGKQEKYYDAGWHEVDPSERLQVTKTEAQVWLAVYNLVQEPECRRKYEFTTFNKNELLKLRGRFNDVLVDQLPILTALRRSLEELAVMDAPPPEASVVVEQLPEIREQLLKINAKKWGAIAEFQKARVFCADDATIQAQAARLAQTYDLNVLESMMPDDPKCAKCGEPAAMRCSRCQNEWYCRRQCQVEHWKSHKKMCNLICEADAAQKK
eukprot:m.1171167 g.1171167  ORF g.1171167 m.1171167 type:complete len:453 (-) comp24512_c0_seq5:3243-4601(-)